VNPFQLTLSLGNTNGEIRYMVVTNRMSSHELEFSEHHQNLKLYTRRWKVAFVGNVRAERPNSNRYRASVGASGGDAQKIQVRG